MVFKNATPPLTLAAAIGATDTTVTVVEDVSWVAPPMTFVIDRGLPSEEAVYVTAVNTTTKTLTIIRGADGYTPQSHVLGAKMEHVVLANGLRLPFGCFPWKPHNYDPYWTPFPSPHPGGATATGPSSNNLILWPVLFPYRLQILEIGVAVATAGSTDGTSYFGIYETRYTLPDYYITPTNRLWYTTWNASQTGTVLFNLSASPLTLNAGVYWFALVHDGYSTAPSCFGWANRLAYGVFGQHLGIAYPNQGQSRISLRASKGTPPDVLPVNIEAYLLESSANYFLTYIKSRVL